MDFGWPNVEIGWKMANDQMLFPAMEEYLTLFSLHRVYMSPQSPMASHFLVIYVICLVTKEFLCKESSGGSV